MKLAIVLLLLIALAGCYRMDPVCVTEWENTSEPVATVSNSGAAVTTFSNTGRSTRRCYLERR